MLNNSILSGQTERTYADPFFSGAEIKTDMSDEGDKYVIQANIEGISLDQIDVTIHENMLTILVELEVATDNPISSEYTYQSLRRSFRLDGIDENAITADYKDGVLKIEMPKAANNGKVTKKPFLS